MIEISKPRIISRTEYIVPTEKKSASFRVQRRRQRLIALYNTVKRFSVGKAAESLSVSRWTVERDLAFLRDHDLLSPKRSAVPPFQVLESGSEFCARFNKAHLGKS
jgi:DeoR/GlpR family transcriptional regulator of sugar metabolism